jgi:hypothetical protein
MTKDEMKKLQIGDIIQSKSSPEKVFIVSANFGDRITAIRSIELREKEVKDWELTDLLVFKQS